MCYSGESLRLGYADKLYGDYTSVEDVIDTAQHIPSLGKSRAIVSLGRGLCSFLFPDREIYRGRDTYC